MELILGLLSRKVGGGANTVITSMSGNSVCIPSNADTP